MAKQVYTYGISMERFTVSFEAEDETDAADALHTFLDQKMVLHDEFSVNLIAKVAPEDFVGNAYKVSDE